jgi:hypothetical protein
MSLPGHERSNDMSARKLCLRLAVFLCTLTIALFVTRFFLIPPRVEVRVAAPTQLPALSIPQLSFMTQQIVFDQTHGKLYTQLTVEHDPASPIPERLWVWTYLFSLDGTICRRPAHAPVEVRQPFAHGDLATLNVATINDVCGDEKEIQRSYYAWVNISTESADDARLSIDPTSSDPRSATPVLIEHEQKR